MGIIFSLYICWAAVQQGLDVCCDVCYSVRTWCTSWLRQLEQKHGVFLTMRQEMEILVLWKASAVLHHSSISCDIHCGAVCRYMSLQLTHIRQHWQLIVVFSDEHWKNWSFVHCIYCHFHTSICQTDVHQYSIQSF